MSTSSRTGVQSFHPTRIAALWVIAAVASAGAVRAQVAVAANVGWVDTGIDLPRNARVVIKSTGQWTNGGSQPRLTGPDGFPGLSLPDAEAPTLPFATMIGRLGARVFLVGSKFDGTPSPDGPPVLRLYLSMNDVKGNFDDNSGILQVNVAVIKLPLNEIQPARPPSIVWRDADFIGIFQNIGLAGGRLQLSQTDEGIPLELTSNGVTQSVQSYIAFGPLIQGMGLEGIPLDLPVRDYGIDQLININSGGAALLGEFSAFGGFAIVDRVRWLLNNVHADFDNDLVVRLGEGEIVLDLTLEAPDPAARGEGNGYLFVPVPIPLGFRDKLCPDVTLDDLHAVLHLTPTIESGVIHLAPLRAELIGNITLSLGDALAGDYKQTVLMNAQDLLNAQLATDGVKTPVEKALAVLLLQGKPNANISSLSITSDGINIEFNQP